MKTIKLLYLICFNVATYTAIVEKNSCKLYNICYHLRAEYPLWSNDFVIIMILMAAETTT